MAASVTVFAATNDTTPKTKTTATKPTSDEYFDIYDSVNSKMIKAYANRKDSDIKDVKATMEKLTGSRLKIPVESSYNNLVTFLAQINTAKTAVETAENAHTHTEVDIATEQVSKLTAKYQNKDKIEFTNRLTAVSDAIKAEELAKAQDAERIAAEQAEATRVANEKAAQDAANAKKAQDDAAAKATQVQAAAASTGNVTTKNGFSANSAKEAIAMTESGGSYSAQNGQYYGKYQLTSSYLGGDMSPANQERVADSYVAGRYGSWEAAWQFHLSHGWY